MTLLKKPALGWRRAATGAVASATLATGLMLSLGAPTANADVLDELAREYSTAAGAGTVANLLNRSLELRAMGFRVPKAQLVEIEDSLRHRPNLTPLTTALQDAVGKQANAKTLVEAAGGQGPVSISVDQGRIGNCAGPFGMSDPFGTEPFCDDPSGGGSISVGDGGSYTIGNGRGAEVSGNGGR